MDKISIIMGVIFTLALILFMAPSIIAMNRGKFLRNIALWLAIFFGLALIYKGFGPDSPHPLFSLPESMQHLKSEETPQEQPETPPEETANDKESGDHGLRPPVE